MDIACMTKCNNLSGLARAAASLDFHFEMLLGQQMGRVTHFMGRKFEKFYIFEAEARQISVFASMPSGGLI